MISGYQCSLSLSSLCLRASVVHSFLFFGLIMPKTNIDLDLDFLPHLPKQKDVPIGCIGAGFIMADCHLVAYKNAGFNPVAIASFNPEKALKVAERHGLQAYEDYEGLLASGTV